MNQLITKVFVEQPQLLRVNNSCLLEDAHSTHSTIIICLLEDAQSTHSTIITKNYKFLNKRNTFKKCKIYYYATLFNKDNDLFLAKAHLLL